MANALALIQNKIFPYMPEITQDRVYAATWAVTTIAFTALSYSAPGAFLLAPPLTLAHVVLFNKAIREWDSSRHNQVKVWMVAACVVASAFFTAMALRSIPLLREALGIWKYPLFFALFTGIVGYGGSAARDLYQRGLELMKMRAWEPMQVHMQNDVARNQVESLLDKCQFALGLGIDLSLMSRLSQRIQSLLFKFVPEEQKKRQFNELMAAYLSVDSADPEEAQESWPLILEEFKKFSVENQLEFLPQLIQIRQNAVEELDQATREAFNNRQEAVAKKHTTFLTDCKAMAKLLYARIDAIKDAKTEAAALEKISADLTKLSNQINQHCKDIKLYFPYRIASLKGFKDFLFELKSGEKFQRLALLNTQKAPAIDLKHDTDDYLLMQYEQTAQGTGVVFFNNLCKKLNVSQKEVYDKLNELGISTIGEFIEKVLGNDQLLLKDQEEVLRRLETFLVAKEGARRQVLYGKVIAHGSYVMDVASKVAYKAAMVFPIITSFIAFPAISMYGAIAGLLYQLIPLFAKQAVDNLPAYLLYRPVNNYFRFLYQVATRRPFFTLLTTFNTGEMATYASADILEKMRILAIEFLRGAALQGPWSIFTGIALGREISGRWRRNT